MNLTWFLKEKVIHIGCNWVLWKSIKLVVLEANNLSPKICYQSNCKLDIRLFSFTWRWKYNTISKSVGAVSYLINYTWPPCWLKSSTRGNWRILYEDSVAWKLYLDNNWKHIFSKFFYVSSKILVIFGRLVHKIWVTHYSNFYL